MRFICSNHSARQYPWRTGTAAFGPLGCIRFDLVVDGLNRPPRAPRCKLPESRSRSAGCGHGMSSHTAAALRSRLSCRMFFRGKILSYLSFISHLASVREMPPSQLSLSPCCTDCVGDNCERGTCVADAASRF